MFVTHNQYFATTDEILDAYNDGKIGYRAAQLLMKSMHKKRHTRSEDVCKKIELVPDSMALKMLGYAPEEKP